MSRSHTRLETLNLGLLNPKTGQIEKIRCFLDRGSNRTFATSECAERCGFSIFSNIPMFLSTFGKSAEKVYLDVAKVNLCKNINLPDNKLSVNVFIKEQIIPDINSYEISDRQKKFIADNNIKLADSDSAKNGKLKIDMLLGQDCVHHLTKGDSIILPGGSVLIPTWDGRHILAGPLDSDYNLPFDKEVQNPPCFIAVNAIVESVPFYVKDPMPRKLKRLMNCVFTCISSEEEMEIIDHFRNLEALGIHPLEYEISPVLDEFNKSTTFENGRFTVRLPFKDPQIKQLSNNFYQAFQRLMSGYKRRLKPKFLAEKEKYHQSFIDDIKHGFLEKVETLGTVSEISEKLARNPHFCN